jgi:hypothetical protein
MAEIGAAFAEGQLSALPYQVYEASEVADAFRALYDLGRQHGAQSAATEADNATAATVAEIRSLLFKDAAQPAPAVKESLTTAPARSLVERLGWIIEPDDPLAWRGTCGLILREVADWFRNQRDSPETAAALEHEADR